MKEEIFTDASKRLRATRAMYRRELAYERALTAEIDRLRGVLAEIAGLVDNDPSEPEALLRLIGRLASNALRQPKPPR